MGIYGSFVFSAYIFCDERRKSRKWLLWHESGELWACVISEYIFCDKKSKFENLYFMANIGRFCLFMGVFHSFLSFSIIFHDININVPKYHILWQIWYKYARKSCHFHISVYSAHTNYVRRFINFTLSAAAGNFLPGKYFQAQSDLSRDAYRHVFGICLHLDFCVW